jgi:DNA repair exonuclease SbcCD ATPase subunit
LLLSTTVRSQDEVETKTLTEQYKSLNSQMEVIDGYRTVRLFVMDKFWSTVMDSVSAERSERAEAEKEVQKLTQQILTLENKLDAQKEKAADLSDAVDNINIAGLSFSKGGFATAAFVIIVSLAALLVFALLSTRMSYQAVKDIKRLYENTNNEFDRYKHNAVEKEIKLSRELQDYRNRFSEVNSH